MTSISPNRIRQIQARTACSPAKAGALVSGRRPSQLRAPAFAGARRGVASA